MSKMPEDNPDSPQSQTTQSSSPQPSSRVWRNYLFVPLAIAHLVLGVMYLVWRIQSGIPEERFTLAWLFLLAEGFTLLGAFGFSLSQLGSRRSPADLFPQLEQSLPQLPYIDIFIIRSKTDSIAATLQTAQEATRLQYPWNRLFVHIVDCGSDPQLKQQALSVPCEYLECSETSSKAVSYAIKEGQSFGDYCLILLPGQSPALQTLQQMLPFFFDTVARAPIANRTAYVQGLLRQFGLPGVEHPLQQPIPIGEMGGEAAPLLGSGVMFRRQALEEMPELDWSYPVRLGTQFHIRGWKSFLCRSTRVEGALLPLRNRLMALLSLQQSLRYLPWWQAAVSQAQRFRYLWLALWSISGLATLAYFGIPIWFLWTGQAPVPAFNTIFFIWFLPYVFVGRLAWLSAFEPKHWRAAWRAERQTGSQFFQSIQSLILGLRGTQPTVQKSRQLSLLSFGPQTLTILLTLSAVIVGLVRYFMVEAVTLPALSFGLAWSMYNLALLSIPPLEYNPKRLGKSNDPDSGSRLKV